MSEAEDLSPDPRLLQLVKADIEKGFKFLIWFWNFTASSHIWTVIDKFCPPWLDSSLMLDFCSISPDELKEAVKKKSVKLLC